MIRRVLKLTKTPYFRFCQQPDPKILEEAEKQFIEYEKQFEKLGSFYGGNSRSKFRHYLVYENQFDMNQLTKRLKIQTAYTFLWLGVTGATVTFANPWFGLIPFWFAFASMSTAISGRGYMKRLVKAVKLHTDQEFVDIETADGNIFKAKISDNKLRSLVDVLPPSSKENEEVNAQYRLSNYILLFESVENVTKELKDDLRILITRDQVFIENVQLLKKILEGRDVTDWYYEAPEDVDPSKIISSKEELEQQVKYYKKLYGLNDQQENKK